MRVLLAVVGAVGVIGAATLAPGEPMPSPGPKASPAAQKLMCASQNSRKSKGDTPDATDGGTVACVPPRCLDEWCDECRHHTCGYPEHLECTSPADSNGTAAVCNVKDKDLSCAGKKARYEADLAKAKKVVLSKTPLNGFPYCVHNICLDVDCRVCKSSASNINLQKTLKQPAAKCSAADPISGAIAGKADASKVTVDDLPCVPQECVGSECYTCPCVPVSCVPEPGADPGYEGASPCYECES